MTTAHRPTFDPVSSYSSQYSEICSSDFSRQKERKRREVSHIIRDYYQHIRSLRLGTPFDLLHHPQLTFLRQPGQGGIADGQIRDLRTQLLEAEAAHFQKINPSAGKREEKITSTKRQLDDGPGQDDGETEDIEAKRRRILEETRNIDADSDGSGSGSSEEDSDDEEDETAELLRELEKIKRERAEQKAKEEREKLAEEQDKREKDIALGNPLLNPADDNKTQRRWDDDVVFRNQARGTENKGKKEFVNDLLRSDFHKRFMSKYVR
ncbi:complexed with cef1p [Lecanora helva]